LTAKKGTDLAKISPHIRSAERFGLHLATHLVSKYAHIHKASVTIEQLRWARITVDGKPHGHSFLRDGDEKRIVRVLVDGSKGKDNLVGNVSAGINDLLGHSLLSIYLSAVNPVLTRLRNSAQIDRVFV
jgi:urate oxidase